MQTEKIKLNEHAVLETYLWSPSEELGIISRPAILVCPGGAYMMCSDREAEPIALAYMNEGYQTFVLRYTTEKKFAPAFEEAKEAMQLIRERAKDWQIDPDRIAVCGFSAGGHLAAALGIIPENKPKAMILGYPAVIGHDWEKLTKEVPDLVEKVNEQTVPAFITACYDDPVVPIHNSIALMDALEQHHVPFESHIFRKGGHGFSLAKHHTSSGDSQMKNDAVAQWFSLSVTWLKDVVGEPEIRKNQEIPENLPEILYTPIAELTANQEKFDILLRYSEAFSNEILLGMAGDTPLAAVLQPLGFTEEMILGLAKDLAACGR